MGRVLRQRLVSCVRNYSLCEILGGWSTKRKLPRNAFGEMTQFGLKGCSDNSFGA
jgi:hypothetical protein